MKKERTIVFALSLLFASLHVCAQVSLTTLEYWFDRQFDARKSVSAGSLQNMQMDVSQLREGMHSIEMRVGDSRGRWGAPLVRYFLRTNPLFASNALTAYRYWIDDPAQVMQGATEDGNIVLDLDVSALRNGLHTVEYQVEDRMGQWSAPQLLYFLIPELEQGVGELVALEYWFNHGPRNRVEFAPGAAYSQEKLFFEVKDVLPNTVEGYVFDVGTERVTVDDNVFFGLQVFNADGQGSLAVLSDTFALTLPVDPHFLSLDNGQEQTFAAPTAGLMQGLKTHAQVGDTLLYTLSAQDVRADFYDATGRRLKAEVTLLETGEKTIAVLASSGLTYALLYGAPDVLAELSASLAIVDNTGIGDAMSGIFLRTAHRSLCLQTSVPGRLRIYAASGSSVVDRLLSAGSSTFMLPSGIYLVQFGEKVLKVVVP